jgi:hypothetical protein
MTSLLEADGACAPRPSDVRPWRRRMLRSEVDDENAFGPGGVASHVGLFRKAVGAAAQGTRQRQPLSPTAAVRDR